MEKHFYRRVSLNNWIDAAVITLKFKTFAVMFVCIFILDYFYQVKFKQSERLTRSSYVSCFQDEQTKGTSFLKVQ